MDVSQEEARRCRSLLDDYLQFQVAGVFRSVIVDVTGTDFVRIWPRVYLSNGTNYTKEQKILMELECMKGVDANWAEDPTGAVRAVEEKLESLSEQELATAKCEILKGVDISVCINAILNLEDPNTGERVLLNKIVKKYHVDEGTFSGSLYRLRKYRNSFAHPDDLKTLSAKKAVEIVNDIKKAWSPFLSATDHGVQEAIRECGERTKIINDTLQIEPISIKVFVQKHHLSEQVFREMLNGMRDAVICTDDEKLLFIQPDYLLKLYKGHVIDKELIKEQKIATNFDEAEQSVISKQHNALQLTALKDYRGGALSQRQLKELISQFYLVLDKTALLKTEILNVIANKIGPLLQETKRRLIVDFATMSSIYALEKETTDQDLQSRAKRARLQLYHMQKCGMVVYVGSLTHKMDPTESLLDFLCRKESVPMCVVCADAALASKIQENCPFCLSATNWKDEGIMIRSASKPEIMRLCKESRKDATPLTPPRVDFREKKPTKNPEQRTTLPVAERNLGSMKPLYKDIIVPRTGEILVDDIGCKVKLGNVLGEPGGEGTVYETDRPGIVAKIYHAERITEFNMNKLQAMKQVSFTNNLICWPRHLLYTNKEQFVGFLMPAAPKEAVEMALSIYKLAGATIQKKVLPNWDRLSIVQSCISVCKTFDALHKKNIFMGDVNPRNLLVLPSDPYKVYFVDCDSYQFQEFNCPVGMAEYSSPAYLKRLDVTSGGYAKCARTREDEEFAIASLLFHMLMLGQTPFAAKNNAKIEDAIRDYSFAYKTKDNRGENVPDGPYALIWNNTHPVVRNPMANVFTGTETVSAYKWAKVFQTYMESINSGVSTRELLPTRYFDATGKTFMDFECAGCHNISNKRKEDVLRLQNAKQPILCNTCMRYILPKKHVTATIRCNRCNKEYVDTEFEKALQEVGKICKCEDCRAKKKNFYPSNRVR